MICQTTQFTFFNRKHHCRTCGRLICHSCSIFLPLKVLDGSAATNTLTKGSLVRICKECEKEELFLDLESQSSTETQGTLKREGHARKESSSTLQSIDSL
jgi:RNase P subunit RPR2